MSKPNLKCWDLFDCVQSMIKTRWKIYEVNHTGEIYVEKKIELPCVIRPGAVYDKNQIEQPRNQLN